MDGKVRPFIIDKGSCANVGSKTMVEKHKLVMSPQPSLTPFNGSIKVRACKSLLGITYFINWEELQE